MKRSLLALSLAVVLSTVSAHAADTLAAAAVAAAPNADSTIDHGTRNKQPNKDAKNLSAVDVTAALDQSRNSLR